MAKRTGNYRTGPTGLHKTHCSCGELRLQMLEGDTIRHCIQCHEVKPTPDFHPKKEAWGGTDARCKLCVNSNTAKSYRENIPRSRNNHLKREYGIDLILYDAMLSEQGGCCAICGSLPEEGKRLYVDHDHATGKVRKLLCQYCNTLLGMADDNTATLEKALNYLKMHKTM